MIFRRSSEPTPAPRKAAPQNGKQPYDARREPAVSTRPLPNGTAAQHMSQNAPQPGPVNPITVAQARRTQQNNPASNFSGKDQLRKLTVGRDISLNGEIGTCDHLIVEGTVHATIKGGKILEISDTGTFAGVVDIEQADIAGRFDGDLIVRGKLIIRPTAIVTGTLYYNRLQVDTGATINAQLNALESVVQQDNQPIATEQAEQSYAAPIQQAVQQSPQNYSQPQDSQRMFSLASLNDEPGFLRANAN